MSYILEALKKADRERSLAKVPTLTTVQLPVHVAKGRGALWAAAAVLVGGGAAAWSLWLYHSGVSAPPVVSGTAIEAPAPVESLTLDRVPSPPVPATAMRPGPAPAPAVPSVAPPREAVRKREPEVAVPLRPPRPEPSQPPQAIPSPAPPAASGPVSEAPAPPPQRLEPLPRSDQFQAPPVPVPMTPPGPPGQATLREASAKLTLDVFVYTDVEADRMVIISGKRYVKGQLVEGLYLVEDITPEGVVLSSRGERILLRP